MNEPAQIPALLPVLPEIMIALGAMALLMFGVYRGERSAQLTNGIAIALLLVAAVLWLGYRDRLRAAWREAAPA